LFNKNKKNVNGKVVDTLVGAETSMTGELNSKGIIRIEGSFKGKIVTENNVIIGEKATVSGDVICLNASISGKLEGNIEVEKKLDVFSSGSVFGDIIVGRLMMEDGALFIGNCLMHKPEEKKSENTVKTKVG
jgi:cytoskeletal protein CcmA (bactofilin family)